MNKMNRDKKKLSFATQTIRTLRAQTIEQVVGGAINLTKISCTDPHCTATYTSDGSTF